MRELDAAVAVGPAADNQEALKAQAEHEQDRPDRDLAELTRQLATWTEEHEGGIERHGRSA
jgi:hypothetical protein